MVLKSSWPGDALCKKFNLDPEKDVNVVFLRTATCGYCASSTATPNSSKVIVCMARERYDSGTWAHWDGVCEVCVDAQAGFWPISN